MSRSNLVDLSVKVHAKTAKAILVSDSGDEADAVWVPFSQCECDGLDRRDGVITLTLPEWLATDKGLI